MYVCGWMNQRPNTWEKRMYGPSNIKTIFPFFLTFKARIGQFYKWGCIKYDWDTDFPNFDVSLSILYISSSILSQSYKSNQKILLLLRGRPPKPSQIIYIYIALSGTNQLVEPLHFVSLIQKQGGEIDS